MATRITAYRGNDGKIYETQHAAEEAEIDAAISYLLSCDKHHLSNIMSGHSDCQATRDALQLLAGKLPPICAEGGKAA